MKRFFALAAFVCLSLLGFAQSGTTLSPTGLYQPGHNQQQWDIPLNQNFALLNKFLGGAQAVPAIVMQGPINLGYGPYSTMIQYSPATNARFTQTDATTPGVCGSPGGGSYTVDCEGNGSAWVASIPVAIPGGSGGTAGIAPGLVTAINCPSSAIQSLNPTTCAASSSGGNGGVYNSGPISAVSGTGSQQTLYTYTLPGNTLSTIGGLEVECVMEINNSSASSAASLTFGGQYIGSTYPGISIPTGSSIITLHAHFYNNGANNAQWALLEYNIAQSGSYIQGSAVPQTTLAVDTTANQAADCQALTSSAGTVQGFGFYVNRAQQ